MEQGDKSKIIARYLERINSFGHGPAAIGEPRERQPFFFHFIVAADGFKSNSSILDIGCGYGDLYGYLRSTGWNGRYKGVDVNPALIEEGRKRYPKADLEIMDIQEHLPSEQFDWCAACGVLSARVEDVAYLTHLKDLLSRMWNISRQGLMFNLLSPLADYVHPFHARPPFADVLAIVNGITNRFTLKHDYMPFDYAIYLYKENMVNRDSLCFTAHNNLLRTLQDQWRRQEL